MGTTKVTFTGDKTNLEQAYRDLQKRVVELEQANQKLAQASERANRKQIDNTKQQNAAIDAGAAKLQAVAMRWIGVASAIEAASTELQKHHELQDKAAQSQLTLARTQAELFQGMAGATPAERTAAVRGIRRIANEERFGDERQLTGAFSAAYGVNGGDVKAALDSIRQGARLTRQTPEDAPAIAAGIALLQNIGGLSGSEAAGFMATAGDISPIAKLQQRSEHIPGAIVSAVGTVPNQNRLQAMREAAALHAVLANASADFEGARSRTAVASLTGQIEEFFREGVPVNIDGMQVKIKPNEDPGTIAGRLELLQGDAKLRKRFLDQANFEQNFRVPVRELLGDRESQLARNFRDFVPKITADTTSLEALQRDLRQGTPELSLADTRRISEGVQQQQELANTEDARAAEARRILSEALMQTAEYTQMPFGMRYVTNKLAVFNQDINEALGYGPEESAIHMLEERQNEVRMRNRSIVFREGLGELTPVDQLNAEERRDFEYLGRQIEALKQQMERVANSNEQMNQRDAARDNKRPAASGAAADVGRQSER